MHMTNCSLNTWIPEKPPNQILQMKMVSLLRFNNNNNDIFAIFQSTVQSNKNIFHFLGHMKTVCFKGLFANLKKVG